MAPAPAASPNRVLLADVAGAGRRAVAALLRTLPDVVLTAEAGTADELARELRRDAFDVVVVDDRLLSAQTLAPRDAHVRLIVMGLDDDPSFATRAKRLGASAWILKERAGELLPAAIGGVDMRA